MFRRNIQLNRLLATAASVQLALLQLSPVWAQTAVDANSVSNQQNNSQVMASPTDASAATAPAYNLIQSSSLEGTNLNVSAGSTFVIDVGSQGTAGLNLTGDLANSGIIYVISSNPTLTTAAIAAQNIINSHGALLTTILPTGGLQGINFAVSGLNLNLSAIQNIINHGTISSAGSLAMVAGNSIVNSLPAAVTGPGPVISAMQNLNLSALNIVNSGQILAQAGQMNANTANLVNSGLMQAVQNNINIQNLLGNTLNINNTLGSIIASGTLDLSALNNTGSGVSELIANGGSFSAAKVIFKADKVGINADEINGPVSVSGCTAAINAQSGNLSIASMKLTGDPIFTAGGNLDLSGLFVDAPVFATYGGDFIALAGGDISAYTAPDGATINAQAVSGQGGKIVLSAGAAFQILDTTGNAFTEGVNYTNGLESSSGGSIKLSNLSLVTNNNEISLSAHAGYSGREYCGNQGSIEIGDILICCAGKDIAQTQTQNPQLTISASGPVTLNNVRNVPGSINITSTNDDVSVLAQKAVESFKGGLTVSAGEDINLNGNNTLAAVRGNLSLNANDDINIGSGSTLAAYGQAGKCCNSEHETGGEHSNSFGVQGSIYGSGGYGENHGSGGSNNGKAKTPASIFLSAGDDINSEYQNTFVSDYGVIQLQSQNGDIKIGDKNKFQTCATPYEQGGIYLHADQGKINLGKFTEINALEGDIHLTAEKSITVECGSELNAFQKDSTGGGIILHSVDSKINLDSEVKLAAVGGNLDIIAAGDVSTGSNTSLRAFNKDGNGGSIVVQASEGDVSLGKDNYLEASGSGSIYLGAASGSIETGSNTEFKAFNGLKSDDDGQIFLYAESNRIGDYNKLEAENGIAVSSSDGKLATGRGVELKSGKGDINLQATDGDVEIGRDNSITAAGGDIYVSAQGWNDKFLWFHWNPAGIYTGSGTEFAAQASSHGDGGNVDLISSQGSINLGDYNSVSANGGNVHLYAQEIKLGTQDQINSFSKNCKGGNVTLNSEDGTLTTGSYNEFNAVGGDLLFTGHEITLGHDNKLNAFDACWSGGSLRLMSERELTVGDDTQINSVGGSIDLASDKDSIDFGENVKLCTFNPAPGYGDINIMVYKTLTLDGIKVGASNNVNIGSNHGAVTLMNTVIAAGNNDSGGSLLITAEDNVTLVHDNRLFAHETLWLDSMSGDLLLGYNTNGSSYNHKNNNSICSINGPVVFLAGDDIRFGQYNNNMEDQYNNKIQTKNGFISLTAGDDISLGKRNLLAAGGGDLSIRSDANYADINLGSYNTLNAFYKLDDPWTGGSIYVSQSGYHGTIHLGDHNNLNAVGGDIVTQAWRVYDGSSNTLCEFPRPGNGYNSYSYDPRCPVCVPPDRPDCQAPQLCCHKPVPPEPPHLSSCLKPTKAPRPPRCPKAPCPPPCPPAPEPPVPEPPTHVRLAIPAAATAKAEAKPAYSIRVPEFKDMQVVYFWMVNYAPPCYLEKTAGKRVVVIDGRFASNDADDSTLLLAGVPVSVVHKNAALKRSDFIFKDAAEGESAAVISLSNAEDDDLLMVTVNDSDRYNLTRGSALFFSTEKPGAGDQTRIAHVDRMIQSPELDAAIPRWVLIPSKGIAIRNALKYKEPKREALASKETPIAYLENTGRIKAPLPDFYSKNAVVEALAERVVKLERGVILSYFDLPTRVNTDHCSVHMDRGSIVMISTSPLITRVRNFADNHANSVRVVVEGKYITVSPGRELNIGANGSEISAIVHNDGMSRRNIRNLKTDNGKVVLAEFSILNAMTRHPLIIELRKSAEQKAKEIVNKITKTAACLHIISDREKGPYFAKPQASSSSRGIADIPGREPI